MNNVEERLNLDTPWSIGEEAFATVVEVIAQKKELSNLVEFGSGSSSIRLAITFADANIISIESDQQWLKETQELANQFLTQNNLDLQYKPLKFQTYGPGTILSYAEAAYFDNEDIDCVVIDGPPFYTLRGREACLYQIYQQLAIGGIIILDDYNRESEKIILQNWLAVYPQSFNVKIIEVGHHLAVLQKLKSVEANWSDPVKCMDSLMVSENYKKIQSALLNFRDAELLNCLNLWAKNGSDVNNYFKVILSMREAYGISVEQIEAVGQAGSNLLPTERQRLQTQSFQFCLELLGLEY